MILLMINVLVLLVGCVMDNVPSIMILSPILLPLALQAGLTPVQFGVVMSINTTIGLVTPALWGRPLCGCYYCKMQGGGHVPYAFALCHRTDFLPVLGYIYSGSKHICFGIHEMNTRCLLIRGGRLFSPGDGFLGERADLLLRDGYMAEIGDSLAAPADADIITLDGEYVAPGFIDCHCHLDLDNPMGIGLHPDLAGALAGNSTVFDAGTTGADNFPGFCQRWMDQGQTRVFALLNLASNGIDTWEEASDSANFNPEALRSTVEEHRGRIVGLKLRCDREAVGKLGMEPFSWGSAWQENWTFPL